MTPAIASGSSTASRRGTWISEISIAAHKPLKSVAILVDKNNKDASWTPSSEQKFWNASFNPPLDLSPAHQIVLELHRKFPPWAKRIEIGTAELVSQDTGEEKKEWKGSYDATDITIHFVSQDGANQQSELVTNLSTLQPTTDGIIQICPRFRVLVIGKSGVGKSSLICTAFATDKAIVSHSKAGVASIDTEIIPTNNEYFVLHDSQGFEHGEGDNFSIVKGFIEARSAMPDVRDQIHAIWLCFGIPRADGRVVETGIEEFFKLKTKTPIIAVFTKYDLLISRWQRAQLSASDVKKKADAVIENQCVKPLKQAARMKFENIAVSTAKGYEHTVSNLVALTQSLVEAKFSMEPSVVAGIAQRVNPDVKIDNCILVGRTNYWKGLATSASFAEKSLEACLFTIHLDIVVVWNIDDPHMHLRSKDFQALIINLVDFGPNNSADPKRTLSAGLAMVGAIAGIVSSLSGPAAPIVVPIAGCLVLAKWAYDVYQQSHDTLRRLMTYIVDLILIMQNVFWFVSIYQVPVSRRLIKFAYRAYKESTVMSQAHEAIRKHVAAQTVQHRLDRDNALFKIEALLNDNRINTEEMFRLKGEIGEINLSGRDDTSWDM